MLMRLFSSSDKHSLQKICSQHLIQINLVVNHVKTSKHLQFMLIVYYIHREIFNHFSFEWTTQEWLQTTDCRRFQSTSFSLKKMKMLHLLYDDWYSAKRHYKCKTEIIAEIRHYYLRSSQSIYDDWSSF